MGLQGPQGIQGDSGSVWVDGSRLKAMMFTGDDGSSGFAGWFDTTLNAQCVFGHIDSNEYRCIPTPLVDVRTVGDPVFLDNACTKPAILVGISHQVSAYVFYSRLGEWDGSIHVYQYGGDSKPGGFFVQYYILGIVTGMCQSGPNSNGTAIGITEIPAAMMATGVMN